MTWIPIYNSVSQLLGWNAVGVKFIGYKTWCQDFGFRCSDGQKTGVWSGSPPLPRPVQLYFVKTSVPIYYMI